MSATVLDGKALSKRLNKALKQRIDADLEGGAGRPPGLAVILVGADPASQVYVRMKGKVAGRIGMGHWQIDLPADTSQADLEAKIAELNGDDRVDGILLQLPLPKGLDALSATECIAPEKDVDGLTIGSIGHLAQGNRTLVPCTPKGVMRLIEEAGIETEGREAVVIGRSNLVGRPLAMLLEQANCTVTVCHSRTRDLPHVVGRSDIVVAAIGRPEHVKAEWLRDGAVVIDVGVNRLDDGSLVGDVEFDAAVERASAITPVPGGVGPMTIAMLMANTYDAWSAKQ